MNGTSRGYEVECHGLGCDGYHAVAYTGRERPDIQAFRDETMGLGWRSACGYWWCPLCVSQMWKMLQDTQEYGSIHGRTYTPAHLRVGPQQEQETGIEIEQPVYIPAQTGRMI